MDMPVLGKHFGNAGGAGLSGEGHLFEISEVQFSWRLSHRKVIYSVSKWKSYNAKIESEPKCPTTQNGFVTSW